jgi:predicted dehydrogenase
MSRAFRVGIIGRGYGQQVVAGAFADTAGCEVVDVVTPRDRAAVSELCARRDVDLISVHSPPFLHCDNVREAIAGGHAVLCDKPFGRNADDAEEMRHLAEQADVVNLVNFETRFDPTRRRLHELVTEGSVGTPAHLQCTYTMNISRFPLRPYGWLFDADLGGGWLRSIGSHQIDFVRWTFGEIVDARGALQTAITERPDAEGNLRQCTADDGFTALLRSAGGVTSVIDSTFAAAVNMTPRMFAVGSEAVLEVIDDQRIIRHTTDGAEEVFASDLGDGYERQLRENMQTYAALARDAVSTGEPGPDLPTFVDGLACVEVMDQLRVSSLGKETSW